MVELVMVPASAPPRLPSLADRMTRSENSRPSQLEHMAEMKRVDSRLIVRGESDPEQSRKADDEDYEQSDASEGPSERLCIRRGKKVHELDLSRPVHSSVRGCHRPSASASAIVSAPAARVDKNSQLGMLRIGLSKELAEELSMLPATVFTPATR